MGTLAGSALEHGMRKSKDARGPQVFLVSAEGLQLPTAVYHCHNDLFGHAVGS
jgi:hypothetical protein